MKMPEIKQLLREPLRSPLYDGITRFVNDPSVRRASLVGPSERPIAVNGYFALFPKRDKRLSAFLDLDFRSEQDIREIYNWISSLKVPEVEGEDLDDDRQDAYGHKKLFFWGQEPDIVLAFGLAGNPSVGNPSLYVASTLLPQEGLNIAQKIVSQRILSLNKGL